MSEQKTAKITEIFRVNPWKDMFFFELEMDNGDVASIGKKSQTALKEGDSITYTLEKKDNGGFRMKEVRQGNFGGGGGYRGGGSAGTPASFALAYAKDVAVAMITANKTKDANSDQ